MHTHTGRTVTNVPGKMGDAQDYPRMSTQSNGGEHTISFQVNISVSKLHSSCKFALSCYTENTNFKGLTVLFFWFLFKRFLVLEFFFYIFMVGFFVLLVSPENESHSLDQSYIINWFISLVDEVALLPKKNRN